MAVTVATSPRPESPTAVQRIKQNMTIRRTQLENAIPTSVENFAEKLKVLPGGDALASMTSAVATKASSIVAPITKSQHTPSDDKVVTTTVSSNGIVVQTPPKRECTTGRDNMFLILEDEYHHMNVGSVYYFKDEIEADEMKTHMDNFALSLGRCRQRLVRPQGLFARPYWVPDEQYDINRHFFVYNGDKSEEEQLLTAEGVQNAISNIYSEHLPTDRPLWRVHWFNNVVDGENRRALFWVAHHCIADGQGFVRKFLEYVTSLDPTLGDLSSLQYSAGKNMVKSVTVDSDDTSSAASSDSGSGTEGDDEKPKSVTAAQENARVKKVVKKASAKKSLADHFIDDYVPRPLAKPTRSYVNACVHITTSFVQLFLMLFMVVFGTLAYLANISRLMIAPHRSYTRPVKGSTKQVAWSRSVKLDAVKKIKNHFGVTVNDVLTACLTAALDQHLAKHNAPRDSRIWLLIPTAMRAANDHSVSNKTSGYMLGVPSGPNVSISDRLRAVNKSMKRQKASPEAAFHYFPQELAYRYPNSIPRFSLSAASWIHGALTNVPGPTIPLKWGSYEISDIVALIPQTYANGVSSAIFTYAGHVSLGIHMDLDKEGKSPVMAPGAAQEIAHEFEKLFAELVDHVDTQPTAADLARTTKAIKDKSV
ncbi:wax ester synthase-like acyl-CoA acyltransferase domain-containing protein [Phlyctochytrium arcticum]|nr:wax ester synthase-like acyl-CoA acyltransferase domain-containing protein [Phlyctochytrium arcticum]